MCPGQMHEWCMCPTCEVPVHHRVDTPTSKVEQIGKVACNCYMLAGMMWQFTQKSHITPRFYLPGLYLYLPPVFLNIQQPIISLILHLACSVVISKLHFLIHILQCYPRPGHVFSAHVHKLTLCEQVLIVIENHAAAPLRMSVQRGSTVVSDVFIAAKFNGALYWALVYVHM